MDNDTTNFFDLNDFTTTDVIDMRGVDDTRLIPTYDGVPMLPPVPPRRPVFSEPKHRAPTNRAGWLLGALTLGAAVAPFVVR